MGAWWLLGLLFGCPRQAEVVDVCADQVAQGTVDTGACRPCATDDECVLSGNSCYDTVYCAHREVPLVFPDLGCSAALEHPWPDEAGCACVDEVCTWTGDD